MSQVDYSDPKGRRLKVAESPIPLSGEPEASSTTGETHPLDEPKMQELFDRLLDLYVQELERQEKNRKEQAKDEDYYDHEQWSDEEKAELDARGQMATVYNVISTTINWILGTQRRGRADYKILPRTKERSQSAQKKTRLLKYLQDVNRSQFACSEAFAQAVKVGVGWLEDGWDPEGDGEPVYSGAEGWRNMLWDSSAGRLDLTDARYVIRTKWTDIDVAKALAPDRKRLIDASLHDADRWLMSLFGDEAMDFAEHEREAVWPTGGYQPARFNRPRVRLIEMWFTMPVEGGRLTGDTEFAGELYDPRSPGHVEALASSEVDVSTGPLMRMHVAIFTVKGLLYFGPSPYRHNRFPFTPIWCYRRGKDGLPYGVIRGIRSLQDDINKRASKALNILSTRGVIMDRGAVDPEKMSLDELADEINRPDYMIEKEPNKEFKIETDRELFPGHLELMQLAIHLVQTASGVTDENLGRKTNATSGIAIERRQDQGGTTTTGIFDNLRLARQIQGEKQLALIEQFMDRKKQFRITNMRGTPEFITINDGQPENDILRSKADFVIDEADWRATVRQAAAEELLALLKELAPFMPQVAIALVDIVVENLDITNREAIVARIRQVTGMRDPDQAEPTAEDIARDQAQQAAQKLQSDMAQAELRKKLADAAEKEMRAANLGAEIPKKNAELLMTAIQAAIAAITAPAAVPVADEIARESGYTGRAENEDTMRRIAAAKQQQAQQQQPAALPAPTEGA